MAAYVVDNHHQQRQPNNNNNNNNFKHYCKICKKGFGCGRALGGHMRAHGIGDDSALIDDDDPASDWELDKIGSSPDDNNNNINNAPPPPPANRRMYALRTNPNRLKSCRVCENCGKEFSSWKSFLEHGKCTSDGDAESLVSSPAASDGEDGVPRSGGWLKRKRSFRSAKVGSFNINPCPSSEEEGLANCLMMLSNATVDGGPLLAEPEESCASASKEEERRNNNHHHTTMSFVAPIACRIPIEKASKAAAAAVAAASNKSSSSAATAGVFECKACKKVFNSHQALGGHRASHKKVKGCFAARLDQADDDVITYEEFLPTTNNAINNYKSSTFHHHLDQSNSSSKRKGKVHECSICHRVFSSGQALGGHKRCHWLTSNSAAEASSSLAKFNQHFQEQIQQIQRRSKLAADGSVPLNLKLDLNLPAPPTSSDQVHKFPSAFGVPSEIFLLPWNINNIDKDCSENHSLEHKYRNEEKKTNNMNKDDGDDDGDDDDGDDNDDDNDHNTNNNIDQDNNNKTNKCCSSSTQNVEDEADSKVKLAKLSEQNGSSASPWLQVGIGSTSDTGADP